MKYLKPNRRRDEREKALYLFNSPEEYSRMGIYNSENVIDDKKLLVAFNGGIVGMVFDSLSPCLAGWEDCPCTADPLAPEQTPPLAA